MTGVLSLLTSMKITAASGLWDPFDGAKDTAKWAATTLVPPWDPVNTLGGTVTQTGGEVVMNMTGADLINGYSSFNLVNLNEKQIIVYLNAFDTNAINGTGFVFGCFIDIDQNIRFELYNNFGDVGINAIYNNSGVNGTTWSAVYSSANHAWLRIREIAGDWYWDTAPNSGGLPGTWTNRRQRSVDGGTPGTHWEPTSVRFGFWTFGQNTSRCTAAAFDTNI
jgi:hypothetical protein